MLPALMFLVLLLGAQQPTPASTDFESLRTTVPPAAAANSDVQQLTVDWAAYAGAADQFVSAATAVPVNRFQIRDRRTVQGPLPVERDPQLSADQLVVVGADAAGTALTWQPLKDPRIVRAEQPGPDGVLTGGILYRTDVEILLVLPDLPQLTQVRLYQPRWTGRQWALDLIATFGIPRP